MSYPFQSSANLIDFAGYYLDINSLKQRFKEKAADDKYALYLTLCDAIFEFSQAENKKRQQLLQDIQNNNNNVSFNDVAGSNTIEAFLAIEKNKALCLALTRFELTTADFTAEPEAYEVFSRLFQVFDKTNYMSDLPKDLKATLCLSVLFNNGLESFNNLLQVDKSFAALKDVKLMKFFSENKNILKYSSADRIKGFLNLYQKIQSMDNDEYNEITRDMGKDKYSLIDDLCQLFLIDLYKQMFAMLPSPKLREWRAGVFISLQGKEYSKQLQDVLSYTEEEAQSILIRFHNKNYFQLAHEEPELPMMIMMQEIPSLLQNDPNKYNGHEMFSPQVYLACKAILIGSDRELENVLEDEDKLILIKPYQSVLLANACQFGTGTSVTQLVNQDFVLRKDKSKEFNLHRVAVQTAYHCQNDGFKAIMKQHHELIMAFDKKQAINPITQRKDLFSIDTDALIYNKKTTICSVFTAAVLGKNIGVVRALMKKGFVASKEDLLITIMNDDVDMFLLFIKSNASFRFNTTKFKHGIFDIPLLHIACQYDSRAIVKVLLNAGVDVNQRAGGLKQTPLMRAASEGLMRMVLLLIERGADLTLKDTLQNRASDYAKKASSLANKVYPIDTEAGAYIYIFPNLLSHEEKNMTDEKYLIPDHLLTSREKPENIKYLNHRTPDLAIFLAELEKQYAAKNDLPDYKSLFKK